VPTMYYATPTEVFEEAGVSMVIWANHLVRASVATMQATALQIHKERNLQSVEPEVVSVKEIFRLQDVSELQEAEKRYLPGKESE
jgi:phosphoenolpyruvate phosphomutase